MLKNAEQNSYLVSDVKTSLNLYPHLWTLVGDQLINNKNEITVNKKYIQIHSDQGRIITHQFRGFFNNQFSAIRQIYDQYRIACYEQSRKKFFPLDLLYAIHENIKYNFKDWTSDSSLTLQNANLNILINFKNQTVNGLPITASQTNEIHRLFKKQKTEHEQLAKDSDIQRKWNATDELRSKLIP